MPFYKPTAQGLRQPLLLVTLLSFVVIVLTIVADPRGSGPTYLVPAGWRAGGATLEATDPGVAKRLAGLRKGCKAPDPYEAKYGRANLRMTRSYEGEWLSAVKLRLKLLICLGMVPRWIYR